MRLSPIDNIIFKSGINSIVMISSIKFMAKNCIDVPLVSGYLNLQQIKEHHVRQCLFSNDIVNDFILMPSDNNKYHKL